MLSNTTLELTFTGADALDSDTGEAGACAMLAEVEPGLKLCNACGDPPDQQGLCDDKCWLCFMQKQTAVVEELCKLTTSDPAPCDHPKIFCEAG